MRRMKVGVRARVCTLASLIVVTVVAGACVAPAGAALPEGRVYEQVSPEFKAGYPVFTSGQGDFAVDGESARFNSIGAFAGSGENFALNPYVARRTAAGWVASGLFPPASGGVCWQGLEEMNPELSRFAYMVATGSTAIGCQHSPTGTVGLREPDWSLVQPFPVMTTDGGNAFSGTVVGVSSDFSRAVLSEGDGAGSHTSPLDETEKGDQLFELGEGAQRLVAVNGAGVQLTRYCDVELGGPGGAFGAVSQPDAAEVFFTVSLGTREVEACSDDAGHPRQLFVRVNGTTTLEVSKPLGEVCGEVPCPGAQSRAPAVFQGASEDGSRVFFTTAASLVGEDKDASNDLYMASIGVNGSDEPAVTSLVLVSRDPNAGQAAEVEPDVVSVSRDGSHVYFVARGMLSGMNSEDAAPVEGAENLYVYDAGTGGVAFIADLCSGPGASGVVSDARCPLNQESVLEPINDRPLWSSAESREAQTTADGRFLVFGSYGRLIVAGPEADTDTAKDVYRYDAVTGRLRRVSVGEAGLDGNGDNDAFDATIAPVRFRGELQEQYELGRRAITEDGSRVVFTSAESLSAGATNHQPDVYVWNEGQVGLISSGTSTEKDEEPVITPSGRDVFFVTAAGLLSGDTDGLRDVYDARVDGGFPLAPAEREACSGDACQGALSTPAPLLVAGSIGQPAGGNLPAPPPPSPVVSAKKSKTVKKPKASKKRKASGKTGTKSRSKLHGKSAHGSVKGGRGGQ
jgi:hypothetical protein